MIEYKTISIEQIKELPELGKQNWITSIVVKDRIVLYRELKKTKSERNSIKTKEYEEFKLAYPSNTGIYDEKLIVKYNKLVSEGLHQEILKSIEQYKKELVVTKKPVANASTYLNQKRYLQKFVVVKDKNEQWINELVKDLPVKVIEVALNRRKIWEQENKKEITEGVMKNIIEWAVSQFKV